MSERAMPNHKDGPMYRRGFRDGARGLPPLPLTGYARVEYEAGYLAGQSAYDAVAPFRYRPLRAGT